MLYHITNVEWQVLQAAMLVISKPIRWHFPFAANVAAVIVYQV